jgi:hypothetical protein
MRILVCGSRDWNDFSKIENILKTYANTENNNSNTIIHGGCRGADSIGGYIGKKLNMNIAVYKAQWNKYGKAAGPIRNQQMIDEGKPDIVYAFHSCIEKSKGTKDMVNKAIENNIPVHIVK